MINCLLIVNGLDTILGKKREGGGNCDNKRKRRAFANRKSKRDGRMRKKPILHRKRVQKEEEGTSNERVYGHFRGK